MAQQGTRWFRHILTGHLEERKGIGKKPKRKGWVKRLNIHQSVQNGNDARSKQALIDFPYFSVI
jgi:hypothetical protein